MINERSYRAGSTDLDAAEDVASKRLSPEQQATVENNIALVHHIVTRMTEGFPASEQRDDLIQAGLLGLIEAAKRFDPELGFTFSTYAGRRIEGAVLDLLRRSDWAPRSVRRKERKLQGITVDLTATLGRPPTLHEVADAMGCEPSDIDSIRADVAQAHVNSLFDRPKTVDSDGVGSIADLPPGPSNDGAHDLEHKELMGYLRDGIDLLPERHRIVVIGHFLEGRSMTELGEFLGVTQSRASQLKSEALIMLKGALDANLGEPQTDAPSEASTRQRAYNDAVGTASSWRGRLGPNLASA